MEEVDLKNIEFYEETEFKQTEIGLIPKDWEVVKLGEVAEFETGKRMKGGALSNGEVLSIGGEHINDFGNICLLKPKFISKDFYKKMIKGKIKDGDIIMCKDGAKTGKVAYVNCESLPSKMIAINEHIFIIRSKNFKIIDNKFIFFYLFSDFGQKQIKKAYHGLIGGITNQNIFNFFISLPLLSEQKVIAYILSIIQEAKEKTERVIEATKNLKKSLMKHLFTYGPVPLSDIDKVELKETKIGLIPKLWEVVRLMEIATVKYGKAKPNQLGNVPVIGSGGKYAYTSYPLIDYPTIVIGRKGTAGKVWLISEPCYPSDTTFYLEWLNISIDISFIFYYMSEHTLSGENAKTTLPSIQKHDLDNMLIPLPPLTEQQKIAEILSSVDEKIQKEEERKRALENLFKSMLHNLMTGKIRVRSLNSKG